MSGILQQSSRYFKFGSEFVQEHEFTTEREDNTETLASRLIAKLSHKKNTE